MNLKDFLVKKRLRPEDFARLAQVSHVTIYRLLKMKEGYAPHLSTLARIERVTEGMVSVEEMMACQK